MCDTILVALGKQRCGADDILRMVVTNLLQWPELAVAGGLLRDNIARLHINSLAWFGADEVHLTGIQHPNLYVISQIAQLLIYSVFDDLLDVRNTFSLSLP